MRAAIGNRSSSPAAKGNDEILPFAKGSDEIPPGPPFAKGSDEIPPGPPFAKGGTHRRKFEKTPYAQQDKNPPLKKGGRGDLALVSISPASPL